MSRERTKYSAAWQTLSGRIPRPGFAHSGSTDSKKITLIHRTTGSQYMNEATNLFINICRLFYLIVFCGNRREYYASEGLFGMASLVSF